MFQEQSVVLLENVPYVDLHRRKQTYLYGVAIVTEIMAGEKCVFLAIARTIQQDVLSVHRAGAESRVEPPDKPSYAEARALCKVLGILTDDFYGICVIFSN